MKTLADSGEMPVENEADVVHVRQAVRVLAQTAGFGLVDQTKLVTAASELARNIVKYAGTGKMAWQIQRQANKSGLQLIFADKGPGIADLSLALTDGWTSGGGLGLGLSGSKRLVNDFDIQSAPGQGTTVTVARWKM